MLPSIITSFKTPYPVTSLHFFPFPELCGVGHCFSFTLLLYVLWWISSVLPLLQSLLTSPFCRSPTSTTSLSGLKITSDSSPFSILPSCRTALSKIVNDATEEQRIHLASGGKNNIHSFSFFLIPPHTHTAVAWTQASVTICALCHRLTVLYA